MLLYSWKKAGEKDRLILSSDTKYNQINFSKNHVSGNARKIGVTFIWWFTNDEVRVLVRSRKDKDSDFEYHVEYIHGCLSPEMKMVVMLYDEGTRGHSVPEEVSSHFLPYCA